MTLEILLFYLFAGLAVIPAVALLITNKVIYAAYLLLVSLLGVAALYVFAGADFLAITQVMIYIGGVIVLLVFGIMLTAKTKDSPTLVVNSKNTGIAILLALVVFLVLILAILSNQFTQESSEEGSRKTTLSLVGKSLMTDYAFAFEAAGLLILIALIGAVYIAGRQLTRKHND